MGRTAGAIRGRRKRVGPTLDRRVLGAIEAARATNENGWYTVARMNEVAPLVRSGRATTAEELIFWTRYETLGETLRRSAAALAQLGELPVEADGQIGLPLEVR